MYTKTLSFVTPNQSYVEYTMNIPSCIDPTYWHFHELSKTDIRQIITHVPSWLMWITAVMYEKIVTWAMVKYSFSDIFGIMVNNKVLAMQHLLMYIPSNPTNRTINRINILSHTQYKHTPPIPTYTVDVQTYDFLVTKIVPNLQPLILQKDPTIIPYCHEFKGKLWVPTVCEGSTFLCMVAIYNKNTHVTEFGSGYTHMSKVGIFNNNIVTLSDETIWLCK
jgi:hypothetical protein